MDNLDKVFWLVMLGLWTAGVYNLGGYVTGKKIIKIIEKCRLT
ncbi:hypothetical protein LCGC14_0619590 [marine sediment metagenome]|uniref:Uncharacterized protein n=1 Tax=marine sediment metagenome TaxID=412755 RepID=A0A0F9RPQ2_9ZZZZ